ncbi:uncharacterized protein LACBIDRAFT_328873 [Laccaria bicolor S238N-H82]|uniref:Predicted protein n=1 Tax=Laccaria bicolor (strain S238N-H82 / ATCC MYA-4686) TaxID=486041 RepID=B0DG96_LACBS|nr:uncharacterized protein LACBIDRAFT_328873 [Laccaria bicolor S238N-H82]EDR06475.1 predicted protein [Laccaria bicolor S238N-H82]|eukprot:XP_001882847.1 predicted protein [Laccaria bicolor S238N-H82]
MTSELVKAFNALPRKETAPSDEELNEWHFDLRYMQLEPNPSHIITLIQPQSQIIHIERLPVGLPTNQSGIEYFPESAKEAAPEVAKAFLHAFVNNIGQSTTTNAPPAFAPWKLTTEDKDLASAVSDELKRIGVRPLELCTITLSKTQTNRIMQKAFTRLFANLKTAAGYTGTGSAAITTPQPFTFWNFKPDPQEMSPRRRSQSTDESDEVKRVNLALRYIETWTNSRPPDPSQVDSKSFMPQVKRELEVLLKVLDKRPEGKVKADADAGDADAALDYGLRLSVGLCCTRDRPKSRVYFIKAILSPGASDKTKATAHGALIYWHLYSLRTDLQSRYVQAACHHANIAARLCRMINPPSTHVTPAILEFMHHVLKRMAKNVPELCLLYKDAVDGYKDRNKQVAEEREKMQAKRLKNPQRYRCAAVGCGIEADTGKMLSKCTTSLFFLRPSGPVLTTGECSVIDDGTYDAGPMESVGGVIQVPITHNGSTVFVSSSTMDVKRLKEMKAMVEGWAQRFPLGVQMGLRWSLTLSVA